MAEVNLTDSNFDDEVLKMEGAVFVDFWAPWCGPCRIMGPIVDELANEYDGKGVKIGKLNVDENSATAGQYDVMSIPTFIIFKGGKMLDRLSGGIPKEKLQEFIDKHM